MRGIIAELGNHALGDIDKAKEQIRLAKECGAHYAKMQIIDPLFVAKYGSMPLGFYELCAMSPEEYNECQEYGNQIGIEVFFSVFADFEKFREIDFHFYKISGSQFLSMTRAQLMGWNTSRTIVSIPKIEEGLLMFKAPSISEMQPLFVTPYHTDATEIVDFSTLESHRKILGRAVGYSDHSLGIGNCITAIKEYGAPLIEKHFNPFGAQAYSGKIYRDCYHACPERQLETLCKAYREHYRE
jgi:sialic acid synthase SpsE